MGTAAGVGTTEGVATRAGRTAAGWRGAGMAAGEAANTTLFPNGSCLFCLFCLCLLRTTFRTRGASSKASCCLLTMAASEIATEAAKRTMRADDWKWE